MTEFPPANTTRVSSFVFAEEAQAALVTVVIPAYNAAATIESTLASVVAQTYRHLEINVVDDGSTDETAHIVARWADRDPRIRFLRKANSGLAAARNTGIEHASGEFIAPVDADDVWHPTKIEKQLAVMQRCSPRVGVVYCWSRAIDNAGRILFDFKTFDFRGEVFAPLIFCNFVQSGAPLFRRSRAREFGGYDAELASRGAPTCEDLKFNLAMAERCDFDLVPEFLFGYTMRPGSMSKDMAAMRRSRSIVVDWARGRHPELPAYLFRWASAHDDRECSRFYLERDRFLTGVTLTMAAALKDPVGAFGRDALRTFLGGIVGRLGLKHWVRSVRRSVAGSDYLPRRECMFVAADPTKRWGSTSDLAPTRLYRVGGLRAARPQPIS